MDSRPKIIWYTFYMRNINFISKLSLVTIVLLILSYILPIVNVGNTDSFLTATTFLFGVLYGFEISVVIANFSALKTQLAVENAGILSIFHLADILGGPTGEEIKDRIEKYLLTIIDYPLEKHLETNKEYFDIFEPLKTAPDPESAAKGQALQYLNEGIYYIPQARNQIADVAPRFVNRAEWIMLSVLALFLVIALFVGRTDDSFSRITIAIFSATVIGSLMLLDEIDSNKIMESYLEYDMFNETLVSIGKTNYYPEFALKKGRIKIPSNKKYRVGTFPSFPSLKERKIQERS